MATQNECYKLLFPRENVCIVSWKKKNVGEVAMVRRKRYNVKHNYLLRQEQFIGCRCNLMSIREYVEVDSLVIEISILYVEVSIWAILLATKHALVSSEALVDIQQTGTKRFFSTFLARTDKVQNTVTTFVFPAKYSLGAFKRRLNRHILGKLSTLNLIIYCFPLGTIVVKCKPIKKIM